MSVGAQVESGRGGDAAADRTGMDDGTNDLYKVNQVYFRMMPTLSLVSKRTILINQSQKNTYTGVNDTLVYTFNTGEYYVAPATSYLFWQGGYRNNSEATNATTDPPYTGVTAAAGTGFGTAKALISQGNLLSLFEEITFTSSSGTEIERQTNKGLNNAFVYRYNNTQEYINTNGQLQGAPYGPYHMIHDGVAPVRGTLGSTIVGAAATVQYSLEAMYPTLWGSEGVGLPRAGSGARSQFGIACQDLVVKSYGTLSTGVKDTVTATYETLDYPSFTVPLDQVLGCFQPYMNCLFPAGALAGGRLEMRLKSPVESLQFTDTVVESPAGTTRSQGLANLVNAAANLVTYRTFIAFDAFQMQDNVLKRLNQVSAGEDGLSVLFDTYDHVTTPFTGTGNMECQVNQARSRMVRSWNVVRDATAITNPYINSLAAENMTNRICGKVGPGTGTYNVITGSAAPAASTQSYRQFGGGGLTYWTLLNPSQVTTDVTPRLQLTAGTMLPGLFEYQPALPPDTFLGTSNYDYPVISSFQSNLGALYFPQQPITTAAELYKSSLYIFCKGEPDKTNTCSVTFEDFKGGKGSGFWTLASALPGIDPSLGTSLGTAVAGAIPTGMWCAPYGMGITGFIAEKSQALQLSGLPICNARSLRHKFTFAIASISGNRTISTFTQFTRVMKVFLGGRVVVRE